MMDNDNGNDDNGATGNEVDNVGKGTMGDNDDDNSNDGDSTGDGAT